MHASPPPTLPLVLCSDHFSILLFFLLLSQTQKLVEEGNIAAARSEFDTSYTCRLFAWMWCACVAPLFSIAVALAIALGTFKLVSRE